MNLLGIAMCLTALLCAASSGHRAEMSPVVAGFIPAASTLSAAYEMDSQPPSFAGETVALYCHTGTDGGWIVTEKDYVTHSAINLEGLAKRINSVCKKNGPLVAFRAASSGDSVAWAVLDGRGLKIASCSIDGTRFRSWRSGGFAPRIYWLPDGTLFACETSGPMSNPPREVDIFDSARPDPPRKYAVPGRVVLSFFGGVRSRSSIFDIQADDYLLTLGAMRNGKMTIGFNDNMRFSILSPRRGFVTVSSNELSLPVGGMLTGGAVNSSRQLIVWTVYTLERTELWLTDASGKQSRCLGYANKGCLLEDVTWGPSGKSIKFWDGSRVWIVQAEL